MPEVRLLKESDYDAYIELLESRREDTLRKRGHDVMETFAPYIKKYLNEDDPNRGIFGAVDDDGLIISSLGFVRWDEWEPCNTMNFQFVHRKFINRYHKNMLREVLTHYLEYWEPRGIYTHYHTQPANGKQLSSGFYSESEARQRYIGFYEYFVPAGEKPKYNLYWAVMAYQIRTYDCIIKSIKLKPEFHPLYKEFQPRYRRKK